MRRCNTRDPTLLRAIVQEGAIDSANGVVLGFATGLSLFSAGRQRHQRASGRACAGWIWSGDDRDRESKCPISVTKPGPEGGVEVGRIKSLGTQKFATSLLAPFHNNHISSTISATSVVFIAAY